MTCGPVSMLPATEKLSPATWPHHSMHWMPVCAATLPSASTTCSSRWSRPPSGSIRASTTSADDKPCESIDKPREPYSGLTNAWVASAPIPLCACEHSAPTAKKRLATATPKAPLGDRATIDQVMRPFFASRFLHAIRIQHCEASFEGLAALAILAVRYSCQHVEQQRQQHHRVEAQVNRQKGRQNGRDHRRAGV